MATKKLVLTTISQGKIAVVESAERADDKRGERYISEDCLAVNLKNGAFTDITATGANPEGRLYMFTEDM
jgi:hypothetical protein